MLAVLESSEPTFLLHFVQLGADRIVSPAICGYFAAGNRQGPRIASWKIVAVPLGANVMDLSDDSPVDQVDCVVVQNVVVTLMSDRKFGVCLMGNSSHDLALGNVMGHQFFA